MKLIFLFLLLGMMQVTASVYSQNTRLSLEMNNAKVSEILNAIENQSEYRFAYSPGYIDLNREVTVDIRGKTISESLKMIFANTNVDFGIFDRHILLYPKDMAIGKNPVTSHARGKQKHSVSGKVTGEDGVGIPGVNIYIKGTNEGTITDLDGNYSIEVTSKNPTLVFSYVGMIKQEIEVGNKTIIDVTMVANPIGIEEVVAVGYGVQKKVNLTGAIGVANGDVLENRPISNVLEGLQGVVGGLNITNSNGAPGSNPKINIRGATSISGGGPLVLVDGTERELNQVNPNDIESISVLKDAASAAIYGARAAYGVILVTTKSGKRNKGTQVTYSGNYFVSQPTILPDKANSYKFALFVNEMTNSDFRPNPFDETHLELVKATVEGTGEPGVYYTVKSNGAYYGHANTDWADLVYSNAAPGQNHNIAISGGTEKAGYRISMGYVGYDGLVKIGGDRYDRYNLNLKLDTDITDWLTSYFQMNFSNSNRNVHNLPPGHGEVFEHVVWRARPNLTPLIEKDGIYLPSFIRLNPVKTLELGGRDIKNNYDLNSKAGLKVNFNNIDIFTNFTYNPFIGETIRNNNPLKSTVSWAAGNPIRIDGEPSYVQKIRGINTYYAFETYAQYENTFSDKHYIKTMIGYSQEWRIISGITAYNTDLISLDIVSLSNSIGDPIVNDVYDQWALRSGFLRLNYIYKDKYLVEFNSRYDGSSRFEKNDRFGFFPSISAGWRISEESFLKDISLIDNFKLRASYGSLGNQSTSVLYPVSPYTTISQVEYIIEETRPIGIIPGNPLGSKRTWETVSTLDFGLDLTILQGLDFTFDVYKRTTKDMLVSGDALPGVYGAPAPQVNAADLEVIGWESLVNWNHRLDNGIKYNLGFTISDWKGVITQFDNPTKSLDKAFYEGMVIGEIWGYESVGLFQTEEEIENAASHIPLGAANLLSPGDVQYADLNNDGVINTGENTVDNPGDRKIIGNRTPRYSYAIRGGLEWKGFDVSLFFQGVGKRDFWLSGPLVFGGTSGYGNAIVTNELYNNTWSDGTSGIPENRNAYYFRPCEREVCARNSQVQTRYLQNAAYLRLKNMTIGYSLSNNALEKIRISQCRVFVTGENLLTYTKIRPDFDPEVLVPNEAGQGAVNPAENTWYSGKSYPLAKRISVGINVNF